MEPIPWRRVKSWNCITCGICCKEFDVVLGYWEWANMIRNFGVSAIKPSVTRLCLGKKGDGTCVFLYNSSGSWLCGLQEGNKPRACKLWPFKILDQPKYGRDSEAIYRYGDRDFFVYVDPSCLGVTWGFPARRFMYETVPEFIEIALGIREKQFYSTCRFANYYF
jgi:Fe-S-cluster containining protein